MQNNKLQWFIMLTWKRRRR